MYAQYRSYGESTKQRRDARRAAGEGRAMTEAGFNEATGYWQPYYDFGQNALREYQDWRSDPTAITRDPSYEWRRSEGQRGVENSAAARGGVLSGNALRGISQFNQDYASTEYGNEFKRRMAELGLGATATGAMGDFASRKGTITGQMRVNAGQANFNNAIAAMEQGRATAAQLNSMIQSWFPSYAGGGNDPPSGDFSGSSGGSSGAEFDMSSMAY